MKRPNAKPWTIPEQIIEDPVSGLMFQFEVTPDGEPRIHLFGSSLPFGNRTLVFLKDGRHDGGGTFMGAVCKPAWPTDPDTLGEEPDRGDE